MNTQTLPLVSAKQISLSRVLVIGDVMLDRYWFGDVKRISPEAPVPVLQVLSEENRLGGAANVALNVRSLGGQVTLLSLVGADDAAKSLRYLLNQHDIECELFEDSIMNTTVKLRVIGRSQQMVRIDFEKQPSQALMSLIVDCFESLLSSHDAVILSDYGKGCLSNIHKLIPLARAAGKPILIDPKGSDWARYKGSTIITPNFAELTQVIGVCSNEEELKQYAEELRKKLELQAILLTRSDEGMTIFEQGCTSSVPAYSREVSDVTGAGDTVISILALMLTCGLNPAQAMGWANRAGGLVVGKFGTACLTYEELFG